MKNRSYKIILFGATGFTGQLAAEYLAANGALKPTDWALAGRNPVKLKSIRDELAADFPELRELALLEADSSNAADMDALAQLGSIVITTVGPYALYGKELVRACADHGTHYIDITGEPAFVEDMIRKYDDRAKASKALIVNCCGFDSIPADLGTWYAARQFDGSQPLTIKAFVTSKGTFSGGTWASALHAMAEGGLVGEKKSVGNKKKRIKSGIHYDRAAGKWAVPMPIIDPQIVKRSARLRPSIYGPDLAYGHFLGMTSLPATAGLITGVGLVYAGAQFRWTREVMKKFRPSGDGPDEQQRAKGFFQLTFYATDGKKRVKTFVRGGDPGYTETSRMLSESALTILNHYEELPFKGGILTPAAALGAPLFERLVRAGIQFGVME